jgi:CPA2 family monovalent cation:H+ antiporter-2
MGLASDLVYIVVAALVGGLVAHVLRQPLICGYILAGLLVGPHTGGITVQNISDVENLAEIGVALLLFTLGLEFSLGELKRLARIAFGAAPLQLISCSLAGFALSILLGLSVRDATWIGAAVSLSSTMVVIKILSGRDELESSGGRAMLAFLIAQDLAVVPMMLIIPQLTGDSIDSAAIVFAIVKSLGFLVCMVVGGGYILPRLFTIIIRQASRELFFLATLTVAFGAGFISHELGLSFALGAFVAGMLLSEADFHHQALSDVSTLRDLFALIFFVSVGMLFDPVFFLSNWSSVVILACAIMAAKTVLIAGIMRTLRFSGEVSYLTGFGLAQVGEFAFVIAKTGRQHGSLSPESFSLMIAVAVVTMIITPALFWIGSAIAAGARVSEESKTVGIDIGECPTFAQHVVILGGGVVGQYVARVLNALAIPYVVIESDYRAVIEMRDAGKRVIFGDGSHRAILEAAGLLRASLMVITTTRDTILPAIVAQVRGLRTDIPIIVRVQEVEDIFKLADLPVAEIVQPQREVGLEMVRQSLRALQVDEVKVYETLEGLRRELREKPGTARL